jgi:cell wall-associated NlpC family hydrolase
MRWATGPALRPAAIAQRRLVLRRARRTAGRRRALTAVRAVRSRIGSSYVYGASGPRAFDCSGLTAWAMRRAGVSLPHSSFAQAGAGKRVARGHIRPGDLVFFSTAGPGASHVGIATGRDTVVSATSHGVMTHSISDAYWGGAYDGARRVVTRRR